MLSNSQLLTFKTECAVKVVNVLNKHFKEIGTNNRAFIHGKSQVEISVPAGADVDVVDSVLDDYDGVYGSEWFQKPPSTM